MANYVIATLKSWNIDQYGSLRVRNDRIPSSEELQGIVFLGHISREQYQDEVCGGVYAIERAD